MKHVPPTLTGRARILRLIGLIGISCVSNINAAPLPSAFGVWDRGEAMDPKTYPFVRGTACDAPWDSVEKKPGVYDWSTMDQAIERAYKDDIFSLVEVHRGEPEVPALRPPPEVRVVPGYGKGTKYGPDAKSEKKKDKKRE